MVHSLLCNSSQELNFVSFLRISFRDFWWHYFFLCCHWFLYFVVNKFNFLDLYYFYFQTAGIHTSNRVATHFQKKFSILFQYVFHTKFKRLQYHHLASFFKNFTRGTQETSAEVSSAVKKKILINKWLNLEFPYFFNTLCAFWPNSILFQGLENRFHNSILFQYRVETLPGFPHIFENHFPYLFNTDWNTFNTTTYLHFSKIWFTEHYAKIISKTVIGNKKQNLDKQMVEFVTSILFNTLCTFWSNSILFHGLDNEFHNSTLSVPRGNPATQTHSFQLLM